MLSANDHQFKTERKKSQSVLKVEILKARGKNLTEPFPTPDYECEPLKLNEKENRSLLELNLTKTSLLLLLASQTLASDWGCGRSPNMEEASPPVESPCSMPAPLTIRKEYLS